MTPHINTQDESLCCSGGLFFEITSDEDEETVTSQIATSLYGQIKQEIIQQFDVGAEECVEGQYMEVHKEVTDKSYVRKLLVSLSGDEALDTISCVEEVTYSPPESTGPSGCIDLLIGSIEVDTADAPLQLKVHSDFIIGVFNVAMGETKNESTSFSRVRDSDLLANTAQPVLVLLSAAQAFQETSGPYLLFYANRYTIRPFIYYKSVDILLTTGKDIPWRNRDGSGLNIAGVCLVALLLRTSRAVRFDESVAAYLERKGFPKTGFIDAVKNSKVDLTKAELKCTKFHDSRHRPLKRPDDIPSVSLQRNAEETKKFMDFKKRRLQ